MHPTIESLLDFLYPRKCISCGDLIKEGSLCKICKHSLLYINPKKRCMKCGLEKDTCQCKRYVYRFEKVIGVFEYEGVAKKIVTKYKFSHKMFYADFLAEAMARAVKAEYSDIKFDAVAYVPTTLQNRLKRGYDQSRLLSERLSRLLKLKTADVLRCRLFRRAQHKSDFKGRFINIRDKYYFKSRLKGGSILLVDDIKTTGATLDECARQLLLAGADRVYCVTALETVPKYNKS